MYGIAAILIGLAALLWAVGTLLKAVDFKLKAKLTKEQEAALESQKRLDDKWANAVDKLTRFGTGGDDYDE